MWVDIPTVLVEEQQKRLRDAAQAPLPPALARLWALFKQQNGSAPVPQRVAT